MQRIPGWEAGYQETHLTTMCWDLKGVEQCRCFVRGSKGKSHIFLKRIEFSFVLDGTDINILEGWAV